MFNMGMFGTKVGNVVNVKYVRNPIISVLSAIAAMSLFRFTPFVVAFTPNRKSDRSTKHPYIKRKKKEKGIRDGRHKPTRAPPTAATYVAPIFFTNKALKARRRASTATSRLSKGVGTKNLVTNIIAAKKEVINSLVILCTSPHVCACFVGSL